MFMAGKMRPQAASHIHRENTAAAVRLGDQERSGFQGWLGESGRS